MCLAVKRSDKLQTNQIWGYDFEVYSRINWWCVSFINYDDYLHNKKQATTIVKDSKAFLEFYEKHKNEIFVGYNSRQYDQYIAKGILGKQNPSDINDALVTFGKKGFQVLSPKSKNFTLNNYDCILLDKSLKQLEGFMGHNIKECSVDFDIDRPMTQEEIQEVIDYNIHDVWEVLAVLKHTFSDFEAQLDMIEMFNLKPEMFAKTKAQLSAAILGAVQQPTLDDEFEITFPKYLKMPEKYQYIMDWYKDEKNKSYKLPLKTDVKSNSVRQLSTVVAGVPCVYGYGGLHGSKDNEIFEGILLAADVALWLMGQLKFFELYQRCVVYG
jgi:hypothetical protein